MGPSVLALTPFEVAVRGRGAALEGRQLVGVHPEAHGASRFPPLEARLEKDRVQTLLLRLGPDQPRAGNDHGGDTICDLPSLGDPRRRPEILDASVGAGADEDPGDGDFVHRCAGGESHVGQGLPGRIPHHRVGEGVRVGNASVDPDDLSGVGSPGHLGREGRDVHEDCLVIGGSGVGGKFFP